VTTLRRPLLSQQRCLFTRSRPSIHPLSAPTQSHLQVGNDVTARTSTWRKPMSFPCWSETLTLRFTRERECELQCFYSKGVMCGVQYIRLEVGRWAPAPRHNPPPPPTHTHIHHTLTYTCAQSNTHVTVHNCVWKQPCYSHKQLTCTYPLLAFS
jgi:hypothetical protein